MFELATHRQECDLGALIVDAEVQANHGEQQLHQHQRLPIRHTHSENTNTHAPRDRRSLPEVHQRLSHVLPLKSEPSFRLCS